MAGSVFLGESDFRTMRESGFIYIDKSFFISEILQTKQRVLLVPRPRRFGKTLNMTMLQAFFDDQQSSLPLFQGLVVCDDPEAMAHLNAHPTVYFSLKDIRGNSWEVCQENLTRELADLIDRHYGRVASLATQFHQDLLKSVQRRQASIADCASSLKLLIQLLCQATGNKVVVLIDEYDSPFHVAHQCGYLPEALDFMRNFLGSALKDNPYLEQAVITGILRIAKESIFSGLNNLGVYTILEPEFSTCFGFTEAEVHHILESQGLTDREAEVRTWYNGYCFGGATLFNPWSILKMAARPKAPLVGYWLNTSGNELVRDLVLAGKACSLDEIETLLLGNPVRKEIDSHMALRELAPETAWSLFLFSGYLTARHYDETTLEADLFIPNLEVRRFFQKTVRAWLGSPGNAKSLVTHLLAGEMERFAASLAESVLTILSYHDTAHKHPEQIFHVLVIGLLAQLAGRYSLHSNRESGHGRPDLALIPKRPSEPGYIFEFKAAASGQAASLKAAATAALTQAQTHDYAARFRQEEVRRLITIGIACFGKRVALATTTQDLPDGAASEVQHVLAGPEPEPQSKATNKSRKNKVTASSREIEYHKAALAGQIQLLQELKGDTVLPMTTLITLDQIVLESLLKGLKP